MTNIGSLNEKPLHAALKDWYARPDDRLEAEVDGYIIDVVRDSVLIEIQTTSFAKIRDKLTDLVGRHSLRLVYPVARERWIVKQAGDGHTRLSRRKSPKRGSYVHLFEELVSFPSIMTESNFSIEVVLIQEEEVRRHHPNRGWRRRGWLTHERRLLRVLERRRFDTPADLLALLPAGLPERFTTAQLARALGERRRLAQRMAYCLREMGAIEQVGKRGRFNLYERAGCVPNAREDVRP
jgi:hypothetical protein